MRALTQEMMRRTVFATERDNTFLERISRRTFAAGIAVAFLGRKAGAGVPGCYLPNGWTDCYDSDLCTQGCPGVCDGSNGCYPCNNAVNECLVGISNCWCSLHVYCCDCICDEQEYCVMASTC
jgi:hypothetical protein